MHSDPCLQIRVIIFLPVSLNICGMCTKEPCYCSYATCEWPEFYVNKVMFCSVQDGSYEYPQHMFW